MHKERVVATGKKERMACEGFIQVGAGHRSH